MTKPIVVITGAAGFLGSSICLDLSDDFIVIAIDCREPSAPLRMAAPQVIWHIVDIAEDQSILKVLESIKREFVQVDYLIHLAAYYDFERVWTAEYQRTNVEGMAKVIQASIDVGLKRFIFASSIAAMEPPSSGNYLTEDSPMSEFTPYARSKVMGERLLVEAGSQLPYTILRIAGVFSDWCELPPLHSLIKRWSAGYPFGNIMPGRGESGIPYIHIRDLVGFIRKCILSEHIMDKHHIFLASPQGAVLHRELFGSIKSKSGRKGNLRPIFVQQKIAKIGLSVQCALGSLFKKMPYERPWMLSYADRPWNIDASETRRILDWDCTPGLGILEKIPEILHKRSMDPIRWEARNTARNERRYSYPGT